jgi:AraC family transcriptional regulator of adaptative response / DNA-3-methyladenine glycosylase II
MDVAIAEAGSSLDEERLYRAVASRDRRFEGRFVVAVRTTGVYCRPGCPAPIPRRRNVRFFACAAAAEEAGFRACLRCRPDASPGSPAWLGTSATVARGLSLIAAGALDELGVDGLAARLGVGARHLRRLFTRELGASPLTVARTRRAHFARKLLEETELPITEVALGAGYASVRRFNAEVRQVFRRAPRQLRSSGAVEAGGLLVLRLPYREPFDWAHLMSWLAGRAIAGVERVDGGVYRRAVELDGVAGVVEVAALDGEPALSLTVRAPVSRSLLSIVERVQRLFDLRADPHAIEARLSRSPRLRPLVRARPGLRVPGAFDPFETAVRAILGQQVSVARASALCGRLVERFGRPVELGGGLTHLFPAPSVIAEADVRSLGMPDARAEAIRGLARAIVDGRLDLSRGSTESLLALPGIGPWTAGYVAMRAFGDPDAFPAGDLGLRKAWARDGELPGERALEEASQAFRPFRAYAAMHLWASLSQQGGG